MKIRIILAFLACSAALCAQSVGGGIQGQTGGGAPGGSAGGDLNGTYPNPGVNSLSLLKGGWPNWVDPKQCDAVHMFCAAGSITTTTGSITTGQPTLTVVSATGWTVGMGIAVAGAGPGATELGGGANGNTCVGAINGLVFSLVICGGSTPLTAGTTVSSATVNHDDTAAIQGAIAFFVNIRLGKGKYNIHGPTNADILTITVPTMVVGDGGWDSGSVLLPRSINTQVFAIRPEITSLSSTPVGTYISDLMIQQPAGFTQTGGTAFKVASVTGAGHYVANVHITRTTVNNMCTAMVVGPGTISNWYTDSYIINGAVSNTSATCANIGGGLYFDSPVPSGDWHFDGLEFSGLNTGVYIVEADTNEFTGLKINGGKLSIVPLTNGAVDRVRFTDTSIEGLAGGPTTGVTIGPNNAIQLSFIGGGIGLSPFGTGISATATTGLRVQGMHFYNLTTPISLIGSSAAITGNYLFGSGTEVNVTTSSIASITGNITEPGSGTSFITSDASASNLTATGNTTSLPSTLGVGTICSTCYSDKTFTVATLPACNAGTGKSATWVSDVAAPVYNTSPTGGTPASPLVQVQCNGVAWLCH